MQSVLQFCPKAPFGEKLILLCSLYRPGNMDTQRPQWESVFMNPGHLTLLEFIQIYMYLYIPSHVQKHG